MKSLQFENQRVTVRQDLSPETLRERAVLKPFTQKLFDKGIRFSWGVPTAILIFKDKVLYRASNAVEAQSLLQRFSAAEEKTHEEQRTGENDDSTDDLQEED